MYHRISESSEPDRLLAFREHLLDLKKRFAIVVPGEPIPNNKLAVCLTFDDAYYDFYHYVYPLLQELNLKAVLAIPTAYIIEKTNLNATERLKVPYPDGLSDYAAVQQQVPFCTWAELREMVNSGHVYPASHSHHHVNLCDPSTDAVQEISVSNQLLETQLQTRIDTFVYPYGKMNTVVHQAVMQVHRFGLRIGAGLNINWSAPKGLLYRVNADPLWIHRKTVSPALLLKSAMNYALNRIRGK